MDWHQLKLDNVASASLPLYMQIADKLRKLIESGELAAGERIPPSRELQQILRLSSITIESGLRMLVKEQYLLRHPRRGTFVADNRSRENVTPVRNIGVIFCNMKIASYYWYQIFGLLETAFREAGYGMIFLQEESRDFVLRPGWNDCSGVVLCGYNSEQMARAFEDRGIPAVLIGSLDSNPGEAAPDLDLVVHNDEERAEISVRHLLDLGHRNIVCVTGPENSQYSEKQKYGFARAMAEYRASVGDNNYIDVKDLTFDEGIKAGYRIFCNGARPTAIYCGSDMVATGLVRAAEKLGLEVPNDVSIIGCGGLDVALNAKPRITTTISKPEECARVAACKLLDRISGRRTGKEVSVVRVTEIDFGDSTIVYRNTNMAANA